MSKALVVLSGGQDSTICLFIAKQNYDEVYAVTFDYNQRHKIEIKSAAEVASLANVKNHEIIRLGPILNGKSPLTDNSKELETYQDFNTMDKVIGDRVELTFVPMRNDLFLTVAINRAFCLDIFNVITGVCQADNANYPDCRASYIIRKQNSSNAALGLEHKENQLNVRTPLMFLSKAESIRTALSIPGCYTALAYTHTSYSAEYPPVTQDHATVLRAHGFNEAGVPDPLIVRAYLEKKINVLPFTDNYLKYSAYLSDIRYNTKKDPVESNDIFIFHMISQLERDLQD